MAIDTPATLAIVGGGPLGLEAALYARFLGYDVRLFHRQSRVVTRLCAELAETPFGQVSSPLGLAAIEAQDSQWTRPDEHARLSPQELEMTYYRALAATDLLSDALRLECEVTRVSPIPCEMAPPAAAHSSGDDLDEEVDEAEEPPPPTFRVHYLHEGSARHEDVHGVIDARGAHSSAALVRECEAGTPGYHVLGARQAAEAGGFTIAAGLDQVRSLFKQIGGREGLDLYATIAPARRG